MTGCKDIITSGCYCGDDRTSYSQQCCGDGVNCNFCERDDSYYCISPTYVLCQNSWGDCTPYDPSKDFCCNMDQIPPAVICSIGNSCCRTGPYIPESEVICCSNETECVNYLPDQSQFSCFLKCPPNTYHWAYMGKICCLEGYELPNATYPLSCDFNCSAHLDRKSCYDANSRQILVNSAYNCTWCVDKSGNEKCVDNISSDTNGLKCNLNNEENLEKQLEKKSRKIKARRKD